MIAVLFMSIIHDPDGRYKRSLQRTVERAISSNSDTCDLVYHLSSYASYAQIDQTYSDDSEESKIETANLVKKYMADILEVSKSAYYTKPEFLTEFTKISKKIDESYLAADLIENAGETYYPLCHWFREIEVEVSGGYETTVNNVPEPETNVKVDLAGKECDEVDAISPDGKYICVWSGTGVWVLRENASSKTPYQPPQKIGRWEERCSFNNVPNPNYDARRGYSAGVNMPFVTVQQCTQVYIQE